MRPSGDEDDGATRRRDQILALLRTGERQRVPGVADKISCSYITGKREVDTLKDAGVIEFVGPEKTGYYRILKSAKPYRV